MPLKILLVIATDSEAEPLKRNAVLKFTGNGFSIGNHIVNLLVTGVGSVATSWGMTKWIAENQPPDLAVNAGIAGSYKDHLSSGQVVIPVSDCFADAGIETGEGFLSLSEAGLENPDKFPFRGGKIFAENNYVEKASGILEPVNAITVNTATGTASSVEKLEKKYNPDIETMEGATFFYICSREKIPFLAIRSISNRVEPRNKGKWQIPLALESLSEKINEVLLMFD